jgi:hypothetical protein
VIHTTNTTNIDSYFPILEGFVFNPVNRDMYLYAEDGYGGGYFAILSSILSRGIVMSWLTSTSSGQSVYDRANKQIFVAFPVNNDVGIISS